MVTYHQICRILLSPCTSFVNFMRRDNLVFPNGCCDDILTPLIRRTELNYAESVGKISQQHLEANDEVTQRRQDDPREWRNARNLDTAEALRSDLRPLLSRMNKILSDVNRLNFAWTLCYDFRHCHSDTLYIKKKVCVVLILVMNETQKFLRRRINVFLFIIPIAGISY